MPFANGHYVYRIDAVNGCLRIYTNFGAFDMQPVNQGMRADTLSSLAGVLQYAVESAQTQNREVDGHG
jgi:hypothetical protein